jgi:DNA-directed RNA polymerase subunit K/omega
MGAPILIQQSKAPSSPLEIAIKELESGILPITIRRTLPDKKTYQDIPINKL